MSTTPTETQQDLIRQALNEGKGETVGDLSAGDPFTAHIVFLTERAGSGWFGMELDKNQQRQLYRFTMTYEARAWLDSAHHALTQRNPVL